MDHHLDTPQWPKTDRTSIQKTYYISYWIQFVNRRTLLATLTVGLAGCAGDRTATTTNADAPRVTVVEDTPGRFLLTRLQPQTFGEIVVEDSIELGVVLANVGESPASGTPTVELVSPAGDRQSLTVEATDPLPAGGSRLYEVGPVTFDTAGAWRVTAGTGIDGTHEAYDGSIRVVESTE